MTSSETSSRHSTRSTSTRQSTGTGTPSPSTCSPGNLYNTRRSITANGASMPRSPGSTPRSAGGGHGACEGDPGTQGRESGLASFTVGLYGTGFLARPGSPKRMLDTPGADCHARVSLNTLPPGYGGL